MDPFSSFLDRQPFVVLDGALATELEGRGARLDDPLWSAKVLMEQPELIEAVHYDYLIAGADVIITASYQASFEGFAQRGLGQAETEALLRLSTELACRARDRFWGEAKRREGRLRPLVAASIGPYGAFLADGSEYRGNYGLSVKELADWHRPRLAVLAASGADLLACETIPCRAEAEALLNLLPEFPQARAWLSFSCRDGRHLWHGETLQEMAVLANTSPQVVAMGVNCTAPEWVSSLLGEAAGATRLPLVAYPNSGERWDAQNHCWLPAAAGGLPPFSDLARQWMAAGARLIGGCCQTGMGEVSSLRALVQQIR